jgi:hypothetical protein
VSYDVRVLADVRELDMPALLAVDPELGRVVAGIVRELKSDPWLGVEMRERMRLAVLADCRKVAFDLPSWRGKPRFRLVYRNDPHDGSIAVVTVVAVGPRSELAAYKQAATRTGAQQREQPQWR